MPNRHFVRGQAGELHDATPMPWDAPSFARVWWPDATDQAKLDACATHWQCSAASLGVAVKRGSLLAFDTLHITVEQSDLDDCTRDGVYDPSALLAMLYARVA